MPAARGVMYKVLDRIFSGEAGDMSRFSVPGLIVMALGVICVLLARRVSGGIQSRRYYVMKLGGLALVMIGAVVAVKLFG